MLNAKLIGRANKMTETTTTHTTPKATRQAALNDNGAIAARTAFTNRCRRHNVRNEAVRAHIVCTVRIATGATLKSMIQVVGPFASKTTEAGSLERMKLNRCQQPGIDSAC